MNRKQAKARRRELTRLQAKQVRHNAADEARRLPRMAAPAPMQMSMDGGPWQYLGEVLDLQVRNLLP